MRPSGDDPTKPVLIVTAVNTEQRPIEIARAGIVVGTDMVIWHPPRQVGLPARLEDGQSVDVDLSADWIELTRLSTRQDPIGVAVEDSDGRVYKALWSQADDD
jgi:hypothetical protein